MPLAAIGRSVARIAVVGVAMSFVASCNRYELVDEAPPFEDCVRQQTAELSRPDEPLHVRSIDEPVIRGRVLTRDAQTPLIDAQIEVVSQRRYVKVDSQGYFMIVAPPTGRVALRVRRVGYRSRNDTVDVVSGGGVDAEVRMQGAYILCEISIRGAVLRKKPWWKWW